MDIQILPLEPLLHEIHRLKHRQEPLLLAIDGRAGSGKSTLANRLQHATGAPIIHMDDYYLRPAQHNSDRLAEPGGNIDYERFKTEVIGPLTQGASVTLRGYRCQTNTFTADRILPTSDLYIIEGSYALHPFFQKPYHLSVYLDLSDDVQRAQLKRREPQTKLKRFFEVWIPLEDRYARTFQIKEEVDFLSFNHQWKRLP